MLLIKEVFVNSDVEKLINNCFLVSVFYLKMQFALVDVTKTFLGNYKAPDFCTIVNHLLKTYHEI